MQTLAPITRVVLDQGNLAGRGAFSARVAITLREKTEMTSKARGEGLSPTSSTRQVTASSLARLRKDTPRRSGQNATRKPSKRFTVSSKWA